MTVITHTETDTFQETTVAQQEELAKEDLRHIINPPNNLHIWKIGMSAQEIVDIARVRRLEIKALCGVWFVPKKNPEDVKKTCDICLEIAGLLITHH